jgi:hypothetical protein
MAAEFGDDKRSSGGLGGMGRSRRMSLPAGRKRIRAAKRHPLNAENLLEIKGLGTIWPSRPAAEFLSGFGAEKRIGSGIRHAASCLFVQHENLP